MPNTMAEGGWWRLQSRPMRSRVVVKALRGAIGVFLNRTTKKRPSALRGGRGVVESATILAPQAFTRVECLPRRPCATAGETTSCRAAPFKVFWFFFSKKNRFAWPSRQPATHRAASIFALLATIALAGCNSLLTEGTSTTAGIAGAGIAGAITRNAALATGIGLGVQAGAISALQYAERRVHNVEQTVIAAAAGPLNNGDIGAWSVEHDIQIEPDEHGSVMVTRDFGGPAFRCKEIIFSIDHPQTRDFYMADVCRDGEVWRWASAEPATARWGSLQ